MQKLRGTGNTFSTSGKHWLPFRHNPKVAARNAKFRRAQAGMTKAEISAANQRAIAEQKMPSLACQARRTLQELQRLLEEHSDMTATEAIERLRST